MIIKVNDENIEILDNKINCINEKIEEIDKQNIEPLREERKKFENEREEYIYKNKKYNLFPLDKEYINKELSSVAFMCEDGSIDEEYKDELFYVDRDGYPYYSSYSYGITSYDKETNSFYHYYYGSRTKKNYIGYIEIEFEEDEE
jgi:hypothetical protein